MRAKKSLGQNFLTSKEVARDIIEAANLSAQDTVLEIGPGKGFLTEELLKQAGSVVAVEKDDRLIEYLQKKFAKEVAEKKLAVIHGDVLDFDSEKHGLTAQNYTVVANIPYYITGQILRLFLESDTQPEKMVLMVQKEVAERIVAKDEKESILSISVKAYGTPQYVKKVPAKYFDPEPKVDSAILKVSDISQKNFANKKEEEKFFKILKLGFSQKRKQLAGNLKKEFPEEEVLSAYKKCDVEKTVRAEKLSVEQWLCLSSL